MTFKYQYWTPAVVALAMLPLWADAEILAMMNYETKSPESLKVLKNPVAPQGRQEGIAIIDVDPASKNFGKTVQHIPLPPDLVAHHIFYNKDSSKAYLTALGKSEMRVIDMTRKPYVLKKVDVPDCVVGEDIVFTADNKNWFLSCMGSRNVVMGDAVTDQTKRVIPLPGIWPHGIALHEGIDRVLVTSTVRPSDLGDPGEKIVVIKASTGEVLGSHKVTGKASPSGVAPVEVLFVPGANPPVAYVTNMFGASLTAAVWDPQASDFRIEEIVDFAKLDAGVPLEIYFNGRGDRLYLTTAKPGHLHIYDISKNPLKPVLTKSLAAAEGAHHVAFTKDWRYAFVQNTLLNLPGLSDGSVTVIDLKNEKVVGSMDALRDAGFNPNSIVLLPQWNEPAGH
ncbi:MAG: YncE family protein [Burkholderiales bacterium]